MVPSMSGSAPTLRMNEGHALLLKALNFDTFVYHLNIVTVKTPQQIVICRNTAEKPFLQKCHLVAELDNKSLKIPPPMCLL